MVCCRCVHALLKVLHSVHKTDYVPFSAGLQKSIAAAFLWDIQFTQLDAVILSLVDTHFMTASSERLHILQVVYPMFERYLLVFASHVDSGRCQF
jgi:hypothetical protein